MTRGKLKVYLGYAAGVGKTYRMLVDAQQLKAAGRDVVIGYFEPHARPDTIAQTEGLEAIPRRLIEYRGTRFEEMDPAAIVARRPEVCVVDEFPHTNVPGLERAKRWEDVEFLLDHGVDVLTTMNIQHLESLNDQVFAITGVRVRETIPDWVVRQAADVVMIDVTPRALLHRLERGVVYGREKAQRALENFFREPALVALRELAMRQTAHEVEHRVEPAKRGGARLLIVLSGDPESAMLIRRAKRVADYLGAECFAVAVSPNGDLADFPEPQREAVERHLNFARNLHIETRILAGQPEAEVLVDFARRNAVTQIFVARARAGSPWLRRSLLEQIVLRAKDMQVVIAGAR
ncbi:MAG: histidine kinase [Acidobacteria bacterium]|nr:histidine kinase [Acidobacteriota bacterium]